MNREERIYEKIVLVLVILAATFLYWNAATHNTSFYSTGELASMDMPKYLFLAVIGLSVIRLIIDLVSDKKMSQSAKGKEISEAKPDKRIVLSVIGILVYTLLWNVLGFGISSVLFFVWEARLLSKKFFWKKTIFMAIGYVAFIYIIFGLLFNVGFPEPILEILVG